MKLKLNVYETTDFLFINNYIWFDMKLPIFCLLLGAQILYGCSENRGEGQYPQPSKKERAEFKEFLLRFNADKGFQLDHVQFPLHTLELDFSENFELVPYEINKAD